MATLITKNSSTASSVPTNAQLVQGELAVNVTDKRLYTENASGTVVELGTNPGSAVTHTAGTAGAPAITTTGDTNTGIFFPAADTIAFSEGGVEAMRLDSSGNLGLGVTPSAWSVPAGKTIEVGTVGNSIWGVGASNMVVGSNIYYASSSYKYANTGSAASAYQQAAGVHYWYNAASGTAGNVITFTQAMTLDASGNLGIGTASPNAKLVVAGGSGYITNTAGNAAGIEFAGNGNTPTTTSFFLGQGGTGLAFIYQRANADLAFGVNNTEQMRLTSTGLGIGTSSPSQKLTIQGSANVAGRGSTFAFMTPDWRMYNSTSGNAFVWDNYTTEAMRIDSSGNLLVGTTGTAYGIGTFLAASGQNVLGVSSAGAVDGTRFIRFNVNTSTEVGSVTTNGTATAYNTSSDYRLKDNQQPLTGSGAFIDALQPKTWNWKTDGSRGVGFIAHEVQAVSPGSVVGEKDGEQMQAMEYGSAEFIANIIAELQSLRARVAALESN
jgi:hypothetical protein